MEHTVTGRKRTQGEWPRERAGSFGVVVGVIMARAYVRPIAATLNPSIEAITLAFALFFPQFAASRVELG